MFFSAIASEVESQCALLAKGYVATKTCKTKRPPTRTVAEAGGLSTFSLERTGLKKVTVTKTERSLYSLRHTRNLHAYHPVPRKGQYLQSCEERGHQC